MAIEGIKLTFYMFLATALAFSNMNLYLLCSCTFLFWLTERRVLTDKVFKMFLLQLALVTSVYILRATTI